MIAAMVAFMLNPDDELIALGRAFHEAAQIAQAQIDAIPATASVQAELAAIDAAIGPAVALAEKITKAGFSTPEGAAIHARAVAWLSGDHHRNR